MNRVGERGDVTVRGCGGDLGGWKLPIKGGKLHPHLHYFPSAFHPILPFWLRLLMGKEQQKKKGANSQTPVRTPTVHQPPQLDKP